MLRAIVNLADGSFMHQNASNLGGECAGMYPEYISWNRSCDSPGAIFITDMLIGYVENYRKYSHRIAWLLEPPSLSETHYTNAVRMKDEFDWILTFRTELLNDDKFLFYPFGGSWIHPRDWQLYQKTKSTSIIASQKVGAVGHRMRHAIIERLPRYENTMSVDVMGYGYRPIQSKLEGLRDYRYSIVVESCQEDVYFSEKLIDCLACGTIPIYWGSKDIGKHFDKSGILAFNTTGELEHILADVVNDADYEMRLRSGAIARNMSHAWSYRVAEDWIRKCYGKLFESCKIVGEVLDMGSNLEIGGKH